MNTAAIASTARQWTLEIDADRVAWLTFDKPGASANSLSRVAMEELDERLHEVERQRPAGLVIRSGKSGFIAGADVSEFGQVREPSAAVPSIRAAHGVLQRLEENQRLSTAAYRAGEISLVQMLLATRQVLDTRREVLEAMTDFALTRSELEQSAGWTGTK